MLGLAIEYADAGGPVGLVAGEDKEVGIKGLHVDMAVNGALARIHQHGNALRVGEANDFVNRRHRAESVRHHGDGHHPGAGAEQLGILLQQEIAVIIDWRPLQHGSLALAVEMPGNDVGVMLEDGEHDFIALPDHQAAVALCHKVDGLGGVAGEDDLVLGWRVQKPPDTFPCIFKCLRRCVREIVEAAVDVGVLLRHALRHGGDNGARLLGGGSIVEIDKRLAIDLAGEDGEIGADFRNVKHQRRASQPSA